jgi:hypothetical protein
MLAEWKTRLMNVIYLLLVTGSAIEMEKAHD